MRIIGIDPGLKVIGFGFLTLEQNLTVCNPSWGIIETSSSDSLAKRIGDISEDVKMILNDGPTPTLAVVERLFFAVNAVSAIEVAQARGAILSILTSFAIPILEPTPLEMKRAITGDGQAEKWQIQSMLVTELKLNQTPTPVDAADALALAYFGALSLQSSKKMITTE